MTTLSTKLAALLAKRGLDYYTEFDDFMTTITAAQNNVGAGLVATSTTSATIGTGAQSLTIQTDKNFAAGMIAIAYQTSNAANFMIGPVSAYNGDTGVVAFTVASGDTGGSGTITDWTVAVSGRRGATGATGGITGGTLTGSIDADGYDITDIDNLTAASATVTTLTATTAAVTDLTVSGLTTIAQAGENAEGNAIDISGDVILQATGEPVQRHTLTGDVTYLVAGAPTPGKGWQVEVRPTQDATGGRAVTILPANLLTYSEQFDNAAWTKTNVTPTANSVTAPHGITTADTLTDTSSGSASVVQQSVTSVAGSTKTASVFLKESTALETTLGLNFFSGSQTITRVTLTWATHTAAVEFGTPDDYGVEVLADGWYRLWITDTDTGSNTSSLMQIFPSGAASNTPTTAVYAWGAQINDGSLVGYAAVGATRAASVVWRGGTAAEIDYAAQAADTASRILISYGSDGEILVDDVSLVS